MKYILYVITFAFLTGFTSCSKSDEESVIAVQQITLQSTVGLVVGGSQQLNITISPTNANRPYDLVWTSSNTNIVTVDEKGSLTAVGTGTATVRVELFENGISQQIAASTTVTVENYTMSLTETTGNLEIGNTLTLTPAVGPSGATYTLEFSSSNETVASVDASGVITGRNVGESTITVKIKEQPTVTATYKVTVGAGEVTPGSGLDDIPDGGSW
ncbi:Ig-like domain-containing protein [Sphingobacterium sp. LRF_L2]|uniref:Ig-like domain-containing protein n=1 Tax=Sphingobacterium sp. LRF_L2 TaxID=3369421 RepID=UPI003F6074BB